MISDKICRNCYGFKNPTIPSSFCSDECFTEWLMKKYKTVIDFGKAVIEDKNAYNGKRS